MHLTLPQFQAVLYEKQDWPAYAEAISHVDGCTQCQRDLEDERKHNPAYQLWDKCRKKPGFDEEAFWRPFQKLFEAKP